MTPLTTNEYTLVERDTERDLWACRYDLSLFHRWDRAKALEVLAKTREDKPGRWALLVTTTVSETTAEILEP